MNIFKYLGVMLDNKEENDSKIWKKIGMNNLFQANKKLLQSEQQVKTAT